MVHTSRQAALAGGERVYFTGQPCLHGHVSLRSVNQSECLECKRLRSFEKPDDHRIGEGIRARLNAGPRDLDFLEYTDVEHADVQEFLRIARGQGIVLAARGAQ